MRATDWRARAMKLYSSPWIALDEGVRFAEEDSHDAHKIASPADLTGIEYTAIPNQRRGRHDAAREDRSRLQGQRPRDRGRGELLPRVLCATSVPGWRARERCRGV